MNVGDEVLRQIAQETAYDTEKAELVRQAVDIEDTDITDINAVKVLKYLRKLPKTKNFTRTCCASSKKTTGIWIKF